MTAKQKKFISVFTICRDIDETCKELAITKRTFYNWCKANEDFSNETKINEKSENIKIVGTNQKEEFLKEYRSSFNISEACERVGIARGTFYNWVKDDEIFKFNVGSVNEGVIDLAESVITKAMAETNQEGNPTKKAVDTAKFILSQRGIKRGWGEKIQAEIIMTPYEIAQETKRRAREEIIEVTAEEMKEMAKSSFLELDGIEGEKEEFFLEGLTDYEGLEYKKAPADFMKNKFLEEVRNG